MGTWGPGLYQNDVSDDIKLGFIDKCKRGHTIEEATEIFIKEYADEVEDDEGAPNFWFALADIQWKYGKLLHILLIQKYGKTINFMDNI